MAGIIINDNSNIAAVLQQLAELYIQLHDTRRADAFSKAALSVKQYPYIITSGKIAKSLPGVGKSSADIIDEFLTTGQVARIAQLQQQIAGGAGNFPGQVNTLTSVEDPAEVAVLTLFQSVHGIGPGGAKNFYQQGYRTLEQLYTNPSLTNTQRLAIYWHNQLSQRIERTEIDQIKQLLHSRFDIYGMTWDITGSYRRGLPTSGDIDLLVQEQEGLNLAGVLSLLQDKILGRFSEGSTKFMGIFRMDEQHNAHQMDIRLVSKAAYPAALMYFTGSKRFNILMRTQAQHRQLSLNEYGLLSNIMGQPDPVVHSEAEIFQLLGVRYLSPAERTDDLVTLPLL